MTEPRRGRAPHSYAIRRVRLVNFHNLVDETLEIKEGGHLFLLGDNGSGKTTVLDAIHLALTGALDVELNAAARITGGRDAGRKLQGIVLRYDPERGPLNEGGQTAYALLELEDTTEGALLCLGVGMAATTMEADVGRWAVLHRGPLESVPIIEEGPEGRVAVSRDTLRAALGKLDVFGRMSEYRKALAERLFGGETLYEEVCRFWSMAKAYREIVSQARDFAGLFVRLLPAPDVEVFADILKSLRALEELEGIITQIVRQERYLSDVATLVDEIASRREEIARYRWLATFRKRSDTAGRLERYRQTAGEQQSETQRLDALIEARKGDYHVAVEAVRAASSQDPDGLFAALGRAEADLQRDDGDARTAEAEAGECDERRKRAGEDAISAHHARTSVWLSLVVALESAVAAARTLGHPLTIVGATATTERGLASTEYRPAASGALPPVDGQASSEIAATLRSAAAELSDREGDLVRANQTRDDCRNILTTLSSRTEEAPDVPGFAAAQTALARAAMSASPLYELLDPKPAASGAHLAALEALLGDASLSTFVVATEDLSAARAALLPHEGVRVVARIAADAPPAAWVRDLFCTRTPPHALDVLGTLLSQAPSLGELGAPDALGDLEHRGVVTRPSTLAARLIGADSRRKAHEAKMRVATTALENAETLVKSARAARDQADGRRDVAAQLQDALQNLRSGDLLEAQRRLDGALRGLAFATELADGARMRAVSAVNRKENAAGLVRTLKARVQSAGIEELDRHLTELRRNEHDAEKVLEAARQEAANANAVLAQTRRDVEREEGEIARLDAELRERTARLCASLRDRPPLPGDAAVEQYVLVERRGNQFKNLENIDQAARDAEMQEGQLVHEIQGDGSRGTRHLEWAGRFGLTWSSPDLRVEDRRGEPLPSVLTELRRQLAEQREVVNSRTRELMETLVMGDLARELQEQVERLYRTVREMNALLDGIRFGTTRYQFKVAPRADLSEFVDLVRKLSLLDDASRARFREFVDARLSELRQLDQDTDVPEFLDYRKWFEYRLSMRSSGQGDTELTRELRALGSGGEQGVPNYLLVLALAKLMFDNAGARVRPLLFDEAFYGIDAGRRDQLLRFATELGLQLVVASPDQDGVTPSARRTTTVFLVKDENADVHLAPYHYWNDTSVAQTDLFRERPEVAAPDDAVCIIGETRLAPADLLSEPE